MSWFSSNSGKRKSSILKRRGATAESLIFWARRFGATIAIFIFFGWSGAWFFMSGASTRLGGWVENKVYATTADAGFQVKNILVEGRHYTDVDALKAIISIEKGDPIFSFKPDSAAEMIGKLSWVKDVKIERRLPDTIFIGLKERTPMALWQRNQRLSLIDTEGVVLTDHKLERFQNYIIVVGEEVPEKAPTFLRLLQSEPKLLDRVETAILISGRRWDLVLKGDITIKLPEEETSLALRRLVVMQEEEKLMDKDVAVIDIRDQERITVRTKPGAVKEYKAGFNNTGGAI